MPKRVSTRKSNAGRRVGNRRYTKKTTMTGGLIGVIRRYWSERNRKKMLKQVNKKFAMADRPMMIMKAKEESDGGTRAGVNQL